MANYLKRLKFNKFLLIIPLFVISQPNVFSQQNISNQFVLGFVAKNVITINDIEKELLFNNRENTTAEETLNKLAENLLFLEDIRQKNIITTKQEINDGFVSLKRIIAANNNAGLDKINDESVYKYYRNLGITKTELSKRIENTVLINKYLNKLSEPELKKIKEPTSEDIQFFYNNNKEKIYNPGWIIIKHIFFSKYQMTNTDEQTNIQNELLDPIALSAKRELAEITLQKLEKGQNFSELVKLYSEDRLTRDGNYYPKTGQNIPGLLGLVYEDNKSFIKKFGIENISLIFNSQTSLVKKVIESDGGYHIIELLEKSPGNLPSLKQANTRIIDHIIQNRKNKILKKVFNNRITELKKQYKYEIFYNNLKYIKKSGRTRMGRG